MTALVTLALLGLAHLPSGSRVHVSSRVAVRSAVRGPAVFMAEGKKADKAAEAPTAAAEPKETPAPPPAAPPPAPPAKPITEGKSKEGLSTITLAHSNGDTALVYTFGACVTSYKHKGVETLMVRPDAKMDGSKPISGGIPHCFPQFGPGEIQQHGFARNLEWEVASTSDDADGPSVVLRLTDNAETMAMWPYAFEALYTITLTADELKTEFVVKNTGDKAFSFTSALHSYFDVSAIKNLEIEGNFDNARYLDKMASPPATLVHSGSTIKISKETDQVFTGVAGQVLLKDSGKKTKLAIKTEYGWRDTVLWNPYGNEGMGYDKFVCAEAACASFPVTVQPGNSWTGTMDLECSSL
eukprot:CAMPEP_0206046620 /NCGR_PEP_ID=MMETSP1466-20131121/19110_1 /ASSEMBLY_ACC=CAM_ASM_001126 /TAXON_ID=44452 /ORGANISM="Pavlova gyrans, Strain CCMP608" /LENGTH=354 /DNA_ID=CAMNT_0053421601 /DNA_START=15 /DNA_END=1079 /DNA_ORIENTATION=-